MRGCSRSQVEWLRLYEHYRSKDIGHQLFRWAIDRSSDLDRYLLQLATDKQRLEAFLYYEQLGFKASHEGMKLHL